MKINAAVIGTGIGTKHIEAINGYKSCRVVLIYEKDKRKISKLKKKYPKIKITNFEKDIFKSKSINFVSIASYDNYHFSQVIKCLKKNINVMVEKPLCLSLKELKMIQSEFKKSKSKISSNMVLRVNDLFLNIKKKINSNSVFYVEGDYLWGRYEKLFGWRSKMKKFSFTSGAAVHMIDLICWVLNKKPISIMTFGNKLGTKGTKFKKNSFLFYLLRFQNNVLVKITANMVGIHEHFHNLNIYCKDKTFIHSRDGSYKISKKNKKFASEQLNYEYPDKVNRKKLIRNFIDTIINNSIKPIVDSKDVFDIMKICFAADKSFKLGKEIKINY